MGQFFSDNFTGTQDTNLTAHTSDSGHTWLQHAAYSSPVGIHSNKADLLSGTSGAVVTSVAPGSADYFVQATFTIGGGFTYIGLRASQSVDTHYNVRYTGGNWDIRRANAGTFTTLVSFADASPSGRVIKLAVAGTGASVTLTLSIDGVAQTPYVDTSASRITTAGKPLILFFFGGSPLDNFIASDGTVSRATLTGPTFGETGKASSNFSISLDGNYIGTIVPTTTGSGTFTPDTLTWAGTSEIKTFTYTPALGTNDEQHDIDLNCDPSLIANTITYTPVKFPTLGTVLACFPSTGTPALRLLKSTDNGINFSTMLFNYTPNTGYVRDPGFSQDLFLGARWLSHTNVPSFVQKCTSFTVAKTLNGIDFSHVTNVNCIAAVGDTANSRAWAPDPLVDLPLIRQYYAGSTDATNFQIYETHSSDGITWSTPVQVIGSNYIDPFPLKIGDTYYLIVKNETTKYIEVFASLLPTSGFTKIRSGNWMGIGNGVEGPSLRKLPTGVWRMWVDRYQANTGIAYTDLTNGDWKSNNATTWSALTGISAPEQMSHGTVITLLDPTTGSFAGESVSLSKGNFLI